MKYAIIKQKFIDFFTNKNYTLYGSMPINNKNNETFFTIAGMQQFINCFLGKQKSQHDKIINLQPCIRLNDLHNHTPRHTSSFTMMGIFRFDAFTKEQIIQEIYDFYKSLGIDMNKIIITTHEDDSHIYNFARQLNNNKVIQNRDENFWSMGSHGPCGTCVEFYYNDTDITNLAEIKHNILSDNNNILEIGNAVFMEYNKTPNGLEKLPHIFLDTGLGLSRIAAVLDGHCNIYQTDIKQISQHIQNEQYKQQITDAIITACWIMKENISPGPEGRNYALRKILRKALFYEPNINIIPILKELYEIFDDFDFLNKQTFIQNNITQEYALIDKILKNSTQYLQKAGENAEQLAITNHTYGVPMELIESHINYNSQLLKEIYQHLEQHKNISKKQSLQIAFNIPTEQCFYEQTECHATILHIEERDNVILIITNKSCFYPTSGGQEGDTGTISINNQEIEITKTTKQNITFDDMIIVHQCENNEYNQNIINSILIKTDNEQDTNILPNINVYMKINTELRNANTRAHSAIHIAIEPIMKHFNAKQAGSYVCNDYGRIDLSFPNENYDAKLIEQFIEKSNEVIQSSTPSTISYIPFADLTDTLYDTNTPYGNIVRQVQFETYSKQLCGGTHVKNTADIEKIKLRKISSIGKGIKRIEIYCGPRAK